MTKFLSKKRIHILVLTGIIGFCFLFFYGHYKFNDLGFDAQSILTWEYSAEKGFIPYKDTFYPYGLIQYYYESSSLAKIIMTLCCSLYFFIIYNSLKKITKSERFSIITLVLFFLSVVRFTNFLSFTRYGSSLAYGLWLAHNNIQSGINTPQKHFCFGLAAGLLITLFLDQGFYAILIYLAASLLSLYKAKINLKNAISLFFHNFIFYVVGAFIGVLPLLIYLFVNSSFLQFTATLLQVPELSRYAKAPFFSSFRKPEIIYITTSIIIGVWMLSHLIFITKRKLEVVHYSLFSSTILLLLISIKNVVRLLDREILPLSTLSFIFIFLGFFSLLKPRFIKDSYKTIYISVFLLILILQPFFIDTVFRERTFFFETNQMALERLLINEKTIHNIVSTLQQEPDFSNKVFSYPTDPIFYALFKQKPPRYFQVYDASAEHAQREQIQFIENENIQYVLYNTSVVAVQDAVPDYVRANTLLKHIITHYVPYKVIGEFLVLRRDENKDFFTEPLLPSLLKTQLLTVNFGKLPVSEGIYKNDSIRQLPRVIYRFLPTAERTIAFPDSEVSGQTVSFTAVCSDDTEQSIAITTKDALQSTVQFQCRKNSSLLIRLSRIPLFFKNRTLEKISYSNGLSNIEIITTTEAATELW